MISLYRYYEAKRMYNHYDILVKEMGDDVPPMIEAQCEFCKLEMEYFLDESKKFSANVLTALTVGGIIFAGYYIYMYGV